VAVIAVTVLLSVLAHGISASQTATHYGRTAAARGPEAGGPVADLPVRGLLGRRHSVGVGAEWHAVPEGRLRG
jgi:sodium/hydrogen antiporter